MEQLKVSDIINLISRLEQEGISFEEIIELPIYLGDDEELNGIHKSWFCELVDKKDNEKQFMVEMLNEQNDTNDKVILIS